MAYYDSEDQGDEDFEWMLPNPSRFWFKDNLLYPKYSMKTERKTMTEFATEFMSGTIYWAKVFRPVNNYEGTAKEWAYDFVPDENGVAILKKHRLLDRLKEGKDPIDGDYLHLKKPELDKNGDRNDPIKVVDEDGSEWDKGNIGNGSKVDLRLTIADFGRGMKKAIWTNAIRVTDHVPHEGGTQSGDPFADMDAGRNKGPSPKGKSSAKGSSKPAAKTVLEDLEDDDIPF